MSSQGLPLSNLPGPSHAPDISIGPAAEVARRELLGFPPAKLLSDVSVARAAGLIMESVREPAGWLRALLSGLDAFRQFQHGRRLAPALTVAWGAPAEAETALLRFAERLGDVGPQEISALGFGPKLWYTANGVPVSWRPLPGGCSGPHPPSGLHLSEQDRYRVAGRMLLRSGISPAEVERLRLGDLGRVAPGAVFVPDLLADPLGVRLGSAGRPGSAGQPWLVLLSNEARIAVLAAVLIRYGPDAACRHGARLLLPDGDDLVLAGDRV